MSNLAVIQNKELVSFDQKKLDLIRKTFGRELTDNEFELFINVAKARGLDPVLNQIHAVVRGTGDDAKVTFQVGIDGFRLIAARTGEYAGRDETKFEYKKADDIYPYKATVTVYRLVNGVRCAWTASAKWSEYFPGDKMGFMWKKLPETMLEKCAEGRALRMAFPNDLSGLYVKEEMDQAPLKEAKDVTPEVIETKQKPELPVTEAQIKRMFAIMNEKKIKIDELKEVIKNLFKKESSKELTRPEYDKLTGSMSSLSRDEFFVWYMQEMEGAQ